MAYIHLVVDLIGRSTHNPDTLTQSYTYALSHLFQIAVDICVNGVCGVCVCVCVCVCEWCVCVCVCVWWVGVRACVSLYS